MIIPRPYYLNQLIAAKGNSLIKVVSGIRRCGKSFLLNELFRRHLNSEDVPNDHIINIALDDLENEEFRNPLKLLRHIKSAMRDDAQYYVLLDEVQMVDRFPELLNSLLHIPNLDTYVTGSNSRFLSKDIVTEFRGRSDEIHMYPLSFAEYYSAMGGDKSDRWREYYSYGGFPQVLALDGADKKRSYLSNLARTVFLADVIERNRVRNRAEFSELLEIVASSIGVPVNPTKLSNTFKNVKKVSISHKTIANYLTYFQDAFLIEKAMRYNVKGKKYINSLSKFYFTDTGLRNALTGFRQIEETHLMENVIYNELRIRGYSVDVGIVEQKVTTPDGKTERKQFEIDFVADKDSRRLYLQSALYIPDEAKMIQETASLSRIDDSFTKIVIVKDNIEPWTDSRGIHFVGLFDFLLNSEVLIF